VRHWLGSFLLRPRMRKYALRGRVRHECLFGLWVALRSINFGR
jgi:hypothetical protein